MITITGNRFPHQQDPFLSDESDRPDGEAPLRGATSGVAGIGDVCSKTHSGVEGVGEGTSTSVTASGMLVDGDYDVKESIPGFNGGQMIAVSSYKDPEQSNDALKMGKQYGGHHVLGYSASAGGWRDNYTVFGSLGSKDYNRACGHQCYPALDTKTVTSFDEVTKYWPMYKKPSR